MTFTKVAPAGIGTSPGTSILIGDSLLHSTGIDIGSNTGVGVTIRQHGDATFTGIVTASSFSGDITGKATELATNATGTNLTLSGNLGVGGVVTYEDVTNIDSVGVITARSDLSIADKIIHTGDTNTTIRFPAADTITAETGGSERLRITSAGLVGISESSPSNQLHVSGTTGTSAGGLLRLDAATGDNFILFDNTSDNTEWAVGYDSTTRSKFDIWYDNNSSGYDLKFSVDGATGAVRKPKNPVFIAYRTNSYNTTTSAAVLVYNDEKIDIGGNYNPTNGRFTAPVTGLYEFAYAAIASNTQTVYRYDLRVNGALPYNPLILELRIDQNNQTAYGTNGEYVCYVNMTAGQYAQVYVHSDSAVNNVYGSTSYGYTYFRGRLIG